MKKRVCTTCKRELNVEDFYKCGHNKSGSVKLASECKECRKKRERERYETQKNYLVSKKNQCVHCGENKWYLLEFHHKDPSKKEFTISKWRKKSKASLLKEIEGCDTLCKNCHAEFHFLNKLNGITYEEYLKNN